MEIVCKLSDGKSPILIEIPVTVASCGISLTYLENRHQISYEDLTHEIFGSDEHLLIFGEYTLYVKEKDWECIAEHMKNAKIKNKFSLQVLFACAVSLFLIYLAAIPIVSNLIADHLPSSIENNISSHFIEKIAKDDACFYEKQNKLFEKALVKLNEKNNFKFLVIKMKD